MSQYGFVYLLGNKAMPWYYKIGCTERSPHNRAAELSAATGVPHPFHVLLYIEVADFQRVERRMHQEIGDFRANTNREFFCFGPQHMDWLWWMFNAYPGALSFSDPGWHRYATRPEGQEGYVETWIYEGTYLSLPDSPPIDGPVLQLVA
jgi:hypothetical protein